MAHDTIRSFQKEGKAAHEWLAAELRQMRAGIATPSMLDHIKVEAYGSAQPLSHLASITTEGPRTLRISVWDQGIVKSAAQALRDADIGFSVVEDEKGIRATLPEMTGELRDKLVKQVGAKLEEARIRVRRARDEAKEKIVKAQREKEISEEEKIRLLEALQKEVDAVNRALEELAKAKEADIRA
ncbi:MAG: ribosome-recycling factor [Candidatus Parcubacteria bacterium]|nr:MAG: ribosome-recycling factor [Candidatus Parcubacteria bacterium]